jgi:hypothetical protein
MNSFAAIVTTSSTFLLVILIFILFLFTFLSSGSSVSGSCQFCHHAIFF